MRDSVPDQVLAGLNDLLAFRIGIHFPRDRLNELERAVGLAATELGLGDSQSYALRLLSSPRARAELDVLASHLTVGETYFFREPNSFEAVEAHILADLIHTRRGKIQALKIWSAACASGEEPYSIAIMLDRLIPDIQDWDITILASDINRRFLQKAAVGEYSEWSFRNAPAWLKDRYFKATEGGRFQIIPRIKNMVTFSNFNLVDDARHPPAIGVNAMDLIFCRNVFIYFNQDGARRVAQNLSRSLTEGGWLITSPVETSATLFEPLVPVNFRGMTFYQKSAAGAPRISSPEPQMEATALKFWTAAPEYFHTEAPPLELSGYQAPGPAPAPVTPQEKPHKQPALYEEALALYEQGSYLEAAEELEGMLNQYPGDARPMELLIRALANHGRLALALAWCEKAIASDKLNAGYHYLLATIQQEQGQVADAAASLKRAVFLDHNLVLAHFALGSLARTQGKLRESEKHFSNTLSLLEGQPPDDILPQTDGMTAKRFAEIVQSIVCRSADGKRANRQHSW